MNYSITPDITQAYTLPAKFYLDQAIYDRSIEDIFASSWQWIGDKTTVADNAGSCYPFELLKGSLSESLVLSRDKNNDLHCLSNVCTHRGKIIVEEAGQYRMLSCKYHGRCFHLDGQFRSMPEFKEAQDFPSEEDNLPQLSLKGLGNLLFTSINPKYSFEETMQPIVERLSWFPFDQLSYDEDSSKTYMVDAHWALYCDNYLEGFHVPFVHPGLGANLNYQDYATKREAEKLVLKANQQDQFETVVIRPRLIWEPGDLTIFPTTLKMVKNGSFRWIDHGKNKTATVHIDNLVHGILLAIDKAKSGQIYFITDDEVWTIKDFLTGLLATPNVTAPDKNISKGMLRRVASILDKIWRLFRIKKAPPITKFAANIMSADCTINLAKAKKVCFKVYSAT